MAKAWTYEGGIVMTEEFKTELTRADTAKPDYRRPEMVELDVEETAVGVVVGRPENVSYIS